MYRRCGSLFETYFFTFHTFIFCKYANIKKYGYIKSHIHNTSSEGIYLCSVFFLSNSDDAFIHQQVLFNRRRARLHLSIFVSIILSLLFLGFFSICFFFVVGSMCCEWREKCENIDAVNMLRRNSYFFLFFNFFLLLVYVTIKEAVCCFH